MMGFEVKSPGWVRLDYLNVPEIAAIASLQSDSNFGYQGQIFIYNHTP
jgi:hypothetical protein